MSTESPDLFDLLGITPGQPPFKVTADPYLRCGCGWCGSDNAIGGGVVNHPRYPDVAVFFNYCGKCHGKYGHPDFGATDFKMVITDQGEVIEQDPGIVTRLAEIAGRYTR